jgi:Metallo-beta-lactamase superfamily
VTLVESYFIDVGQGSCSVLLLGGRRAIVIDTGPRRHEVLGLLAMCGVDYLECLAVSHNHADHCGAAAALLTTFRGKIGRVGFVDDRLLVDTRFAAKLNEELSAGTLTKEQLVRLERSDPPCYLFKDPSTGLTLKIFAPTPGDNFVANYRRKPNATSAVLVLTLGRTRIVYAGDATIEEWNAIRSKRGGRALVCDVLTVPHHGGRVHTADAELDVLYTHCVRPRFVIVSVGTGNRHKHPRQDVFRALSAVPGGCTPLCTQITDKCCQDLERFRTEGLSKPLPGRSLATPDLTEKGKSRNVACAGTVRITLNPAGIIVDRLDQHQEMLDVAIHAPSSPLCRRFASVPVTPAPEASAVTKRSRGG